MSEDMRESDGDVGGGPERMLLQANGWMPNNARLPVLIWRDLFAATKAGDGMATAMEEAFGRNGWPAQWRDGVYSFHHYHSTAHEVLGIAGGEARLVLGGEGGRAVTVRAGEVLLLPTGTGHCRVSASGDFLVVGAYPVGETWDICREAPTAEVRERMGRVRYAEGGPVGGRMRDWWG